MALEILGIKPRGFKVWWPYFKKGEKNSFFTSKFKRYNLTTYEVNFFGKKKAFSNLKQDPMVGS
jgi:hypothetical protein